MDRRAGGCARGLSQIKTPLPPFASVFSPLRGRLGARGGNGGGVASEVDACIMHVPAKMMVAKLAVITTRLTDGAFAADRSTFSVPCAQTAAARADGGK